MNVGPHLRAGLTAHNSQVLVVDVVGVAVIKEDEVPIFVQGFRRFSDDSTIVSSRLGWLVSEESDTASTDSQASWRDFQIGEILQGQNFE